MPKFDEETIRRLFESNLNAAKAALARLGFCCCHDPNFRGLTGWVFEQTTQNCLRKEMNALGIRAEMREQVSLGGSARADLLIEMVALEIKARGLFDGSAASRYCRYRAAAAERGYAYLYLTLQETYRPYREAMVKALGRQNAFFLDTPGDWHRLVNRVFNLLADRRRSVKPLPPTPAGARISSSVWGLDKRHRLGAAALRGTDARFRTRASLSPEPP